MNPDTNGNGTPWWVKAIGIIGLPGFLALYLLGVFDAILPSPVTAALRRHEEDTNRALRLICRGVWRGGDREAILMQTECDK